MNRPLENEISLKKYAFQSQQTVLDIQPFGIATYPAASGKHSMAGYDYHERIIMAGHTHGTKSAGRLHGPCNIAIADGLSIRNSTQSLPYPALKLGSDRGKRYIELPPISFKILF